MLECLEEKLRTTRLFLASKNASLLTARVRSGRITGKAEVIAGPKSASGTCAENTSNARGSRWSDLLSLSEPQFSIACGVCRAVSRDYFPLFPFAGNPHLA